MPTTSTATLLTLLSLLSNPISPVHARMYDAALALATAHAPLPVPGLDTFGQGAPGPVKIPLELQDRSPMVTPAPAHPHWLLEKRAGSDLIGYLGPDNTCGYVGGSSGASKYCGRNQRCFAITDPPGPKIPALGCCGTGGCTFYGNCINSAAFNASCDAACQADTNTIKCLDASAPYCAPYTIPDPTALLYQCASVSPTETALLARTFDGQASARTWTAIHSSDLNAAAGATSTSLDVSSVLSELSAASKAASKTNSNDNHSSITVTSSGPNIGAIVGGAIGGAAVLLAAVILAWWLYLRHKRKSASQRPQTTADPNLPGTGPNSPHGVGGAPPFSPAMTQSGHTSWAPPPHSPGAVVYPPPQQQQGFYDPKYASGPGMGYPAGAAEAQATGSYPVEMAGSAPVVKMESGPKPVVPGQPPVEMGDSAYGRR